MRSKVFCILLVLTVAVLSMFNFSCTKKQLPPKDKIVIGQAVSMSGPLAVQDAVVTGPYYDLWIKDVNARGGIYVEEYGKKLFENKEGKRVNVSTIEVTLAKK